MNFCRWLSVLLLTLVPMSARAITLQWASGSDALVFSEARLCTLYVGCDPGESSLPSEWRLLWVAEGMPSLEILPEAPSTTSEMAQATEVIPPSPAEAEARLVTTTFRSTNAQSSSSARWIVTLPAGAAGKFVVYAPSEGSSGPVGSLTRSSIVTFNGGVAGDFPSLVFGASGDHVTTRLAVRAQGFGLSTARSVSLVAADTSWQLPLQIVEATDSTIHAEAEVPTQLPDAILQVTLGDSMSTTTALDASQVTAPVVDTVTILGNSFLVPPDSAGVIPKDFAFVYNTVPTATPGVWRGLFHLFYIRRLPGDTTLTLGHAWSPDLRKWTSDRYAFTTGAPGTFDAGHVWAPSIVQNGNLYYMYYTGVDAGGNQRIGRVTTPLLDTTNTVWSDRRLVYAADSTSWVVRHRPNFNFRSQFRDPFVFPDPDSTGRFLMIYTAMDTSYKVQNGLSIGLARNRSGTLDRWLDLGRYVDTDYGHNGHLAQLESPHVIPDSGYAPSYWTTGSSPSGWRLVYTWGGDHPASQTLRVLRDTLTVNVSDISDAGWGSTTSLFNYLSGDGTVVGWNGSEHLKAGGVDYLAGYNAYVVDGIQISRMYWNGSNFYLQVPTVTGVDEARSITSEVRLDLIQFTPRIQKVCFRISAPTAIPARFDIYDVAGRRIRQLLNGLLLTGDTSIEWDRTDAAGMEIPNGVYFARLTYGSGSRVARIPLVR